MSNASAVATARTSEISAEKQTLLNDIGHKWNQFTSQNLADLKSNDDLATQVSAKYGIDKAKADQEVAAVMKGRTL